MKLLTVHDKKELAWFSLTPGPSPKMERGVPLVFKRHCLSNIYKCIFENGCVPSPVGEALGWGVKFSKKYFCRVLRLTLIFILLAGVTQAQTCSCAGTPLTNSLGVGTVTTTDWQVQLAYDYHRIADLVSGTEELERGRNLRATHSVLLQLSRRLGKRWQLTLLTSWVRQTFETTNTLSGSGLGDMMLIGQYRLLRARKTYLYLSGGIKLPTGSTTEKENNLLLSPDLQPGTGSWDAMASLLWFQNRIFEDFLDIQTSLTYRKTTATQRFDNTQSYRFGDELLLQSVFGEMFATPVGFVMPFFLTRFRHTRPDTRNGDTAFNTGGTWFNLGTGLNWQFTPGFGMQLTGVLPVYRHLNGTQLTSSYRLNIALTLNLKKS